jgi:hypothetical protein
MAEWKVQKRLGKRAAKEEQEKQRAFVTHCISKSSRRIASNLRILFARLEVQV